MSTKLSRRLVVLAAVLSVALAAALGVGATQAQAQQAPAQTQGCGFPYTAEDATGTQVTLEQEPERVVALGPSATQTLVEIGSGKKVVGAGGLSDYLGIEYDTVTPLDNQTGFFLYRTDAVAENVVDLNPDLVIVAGTIIGDKTVENTYRASGNLDVYKTSPSEGVEDIPRKVENVGRLVGNCDGANEAAGSVRGEISLAKRAAAGQERPGFIYLTRATQNGGASVLSEGSFVVDVVETAGGDNVLADVVETPFGTVGSEVLLNRSEEIDWIVTTEGTNVPDTGVPYAQLDAVQKNQIIKLNPNEISQDAPRIVDPLSILSDTFFPEARDEALETGRGGSGIGGGGGGGGGGAPDGRQATLSEERSLGVADTSPLKLVDNVSVAEFVGGPVTSITLEGEHSGNVSVEPITEAQTPGAFVSGANITLPDEAVGADGTVTFGVSRALLNDTGIPPGDLRVAGRGEEGWSVLETASANRGDEVLLEAATGFSGFAVVATDKPKPVIDMTVENSTTGTVSLNASGSSDEYGDIAEYVWEVGGETYEGSTVEVNVSPGDEARLTVTNEAGLSATTTEVVEQSMMEGGTDEEEGTGGGERQQGSGGSANEGEGAGDTSDGEAPAGNEGLPGFTALSAVAALAAALALAAARSRERR